MGKYATLVVFLISVSSVFAQRRFQEANGIGIIAGVNSAAIETSNFSTKLGMGWNGGLQVRGAIYNDFSMIYAIQFSESNFSVATLDSSLKAEDVDYKISGGQISLMLSYNIIPSHLSIEAGPVFQFNGKMSVDEAKENNTIKGTTLKAGDIVEINPFNFHGAIGFTAGVKQVRLSVQYYTELIIF